MKFGLVGNPLGHSYSKPIHSELFKLKNSGSTYELYPSESLDDCFSEVLSKLDGFNITIPYKTDIIKYLDYADEKVKLYNSCNTVVKKGGKFYGYNTDAFGFIMSLKARGIELDGKKVLVIGSGGVSRTMVFESLLNGAEVYITSRNINKCIEIAKEAESKIGRTITVLTDVDGRISFDIAANGTPCGMFPNELSLPVKFSRIMDIPFVFDTIYNPRETLFTRLARFCGNAAENGLPMLVGQAAEAQKYFCGLEYDADDIHLVTDKMNIDNFKLNKNVVVMGLPGCGKSTVGKMLANILNLKFVDIDSVIESEHGSITGIFESKGEEYFRKIESETIIKYASVRGCLISLGGGAVETSKTMEYLKESDSNIILFIDAAFDVLLNRVTRTQNRPLLLGDARKKLALLAERRSTLYAKYSDCRICVEQEQSAKLTAIKCVEALCGL